MERSQTPFAEARVIASRALDFAQRHRVPPFPRAYEVIFTYVSGQNTALCARIDEALRNGPLAIQLIDQLHAEFLAPEAVNAGVERIGDQMGQDLAEVIDMIEDGAAHGESLSYKIETAERAVEKASDSSKKNQIIGTLRRETQVHVRAISRLGSGLETMRTQFLNMQRELRELRQSVLLDPLTQLPNRRFFDDALPRLCAEARERMNAISLVVIEIEAFDQFVARWGRKRSDHVLTHAAGLLRGCQGDGDIAVRLDTDCFALILQRRDHSAALALAQDIRRSLEDLRLVSTSTQQAVASITIAFGCAELQRGQRPDDLFNKALHALGEDRDSRPAQQTPAA
ncbi:MAG: GGDEF domain-containing protein [Pseudomonadota bacterium]